MKTVLPCGVLVLALVSGCGPSDAPSSEAESLEVLDQFDQALVEDNGLAFNGLAFNGLAFNGLAFNGLAFNGLSHASFRFWFGLHPTESSHFMKYLVRCAVPAGQTRSFAYGGTTHVWQGGLGLAPTWSSGASATEEEQQTVSACLSALTNKYNQSVQVSVVGTTAQGQPIPTPPSELSSFPMREGCFFGNLFNGKGLFVGNDMGLLSPSQSSPRACALEGKDACPPLTHVGNCHSLCQKDSTGTYFTQCTYKGVTYHPLTTRIRPQDIYTCGDGICQSTESCGNKNTAESCKADCGKCG